MNRDAIERAVLGCMLLGSSRLVVDSVSGEHFLSPTHRRAYAIFSALFAEHGEVDLALADNRCRCGQLPEGFAGSLMEDRIAEANVEQYVRQLLEEAAKRAAQEKGGDFPTAPTAREMAARLDAAREALAPVIDRETGTNYSRMGDALSAAKRGERYWAQLPWPMLCDDSRALLPGTLTMLCGTPGASKSLAMTQAMEYLDSAGIRTCALMLEDGGHYHLRRIFAQIAGEGSLTDDMWCRKNSARVGELEGKFGERLKSLGECIYGVPAHVSPTPDYVVQWVGARAREGFRVLIVDPVTLMSRSASPWRDDHALVAGTKRVAEQHGCAVVFVSHPRRQAAGHKGPITLDDLSGGASYQRASQTILWLQSHAPKQSNITSSVGCAPTGHNRTMKVLKARNGIQGEVYGLEFVAKTLTMRELGRIGPDFEEAE